MLINMMYATALFDKQRIYGFKKNPGNIRRVSLTTSTTSSQLGIWNIYIPYYVCYLFFNNSSTSCCRTEMILQSQYC